MTRQVLCEIMTAVEELIAERYTTRGMSGSGLRRLKEVGAELRICFDACYLSRQQIMDTR